MPVGASKLGVLGAGLVPGGSVTFNASGNWSVPPGVKKVSITGKGATGNPGNAGNSGNPGNPGTGGGAGAAGCGLFGANGIREGGSGGHAYRNVVCSVPQTAENPVFAPSWQPALSAGGISSPAPGARNSQSGLSGNAGTAGTAGNPGNPGNASSGLGNTFPGGAGGNAGVAGAAGNGGSGGSGGARGNDGQATPQAGGSGNCGGGSGGSGRTVNQPQATPPLPTFIIFGAFGGGGAGITNSGGSGSPSCGSFNQPNGLPSNPPNVSTGKGLGGTISCISAPITASSPPSPTLYVNPSAPTSTFGGCGGLLLLNYDRNNNVDGSPAVNMARGPFARSLSPPTAFNYRLNPGVNPAPLRPLVLRAGGGGGGSGHGRFCPPNTSPSRIGSGGAGGGRGNAGNAGGTSPTPTGAAATPQTFNCVTVTPGSTTPIVVASPGGQVVISWNPQ